MDPSHDPAPSASSVQESQSGTRRVRDRLEKQQESTSQATSKKRTKVFPDIPHT
jgi:hypothetical protein